MLRTLLRLLPAPLRRRLRVQLRRWTDRRTGDHRRMVPLTGSRSEWPVQLLVQQRVTSGPTLAAKLHNMRLVIARLERLDVLPGQLLSFWELVGYPGREQGFQPGRNIIDGQLVVDYGGGLCQLSSAMYELALRANLIVPERHAHSTNVYTPETAYTQLGLDATLAYGYKDLRILNSGNIPFNFRFDLQETQLVVTLCAPQPLPDWALRVAHKISAAGLEAQVFRQTERGDILLTKDFYRAWVGVDPGAVESGH